MDGKQKAGIGNVVMIGGTTRCIVIDVDGTFVKVLGFGTNMETGVTAILSPRYIDRLPASECSYLEKQTLTLG